MSYGSAALEPPDPPEECNECGEFECEHLAAAEALAESYYEDLAKEAYYELKYGSGDPDGDAIAAHEGEF